MPTSAWLSSTGILTDGLAGSAVTASRIETDYPEENVQTPWPGQIARWPGNFRVVVGVNTHLDFTDPTDGALAAVISGGNYSSSTLATQIETAMDAVATTSTWTVTYSDTTGKFTIVRDAGGTFTLDWSTGPNTATTIGGLIGFDTATDDTGAGTYTGDNAVAHDEDYLQFDLGSAQSPTGFFIYGNSFSSNASIKLYSSASAISPSSTQAFSDWLGANATEVADLSPNVPTYADKGDLIGWVTSSAPTARRYWTLWWADTQPRGGNSFWHFDIGRCALGTVVSPTRSFAGSFALDLEDTSATARSIGGIILGARAPIVGSCAYTWSRVPEADLNTLRNLFYERHTPLTFWEDISASGNLGRYSQVDGDRLPVRKDIRFPTLWNVGPVTFRQVPPTQRSTT